MNFFIPTVDDLVERFSAHQGQTPEEAAEARTNELSSLTKAELIELVISKEANRKTDTVQELAKAMLQDEELIAASYDDIAEAIRVIKPEAKTTSKSIASYVSKKREEWALPERVRINKPRAKKAEPEAEAPEAEPEEA